MPHAWHDLFSAANFGRILGYYARVPMYFPAGIPLVAVVALIVWRTYEEAKQSRAR